MPPRKPGTVRRRPSMAPEAPVSILRRGRFSSDTGGGEEDDPLKLQQTSVPLAVAPRTPRRLPGRPTQSSTILLHVRTGHPPLRSPLPLRPERPWLYGEVSKPGIPLRTMLDVHPHHGHTPTPNSVDWTAYVSRGGRHPALEAPGGPPPPTVGHLPAGPPPPTAGMGPALRPPSPGALRPIADTHPSAPPVGDSTAGGHSASFPGPAGPPAPRPGHYPAPHLLARAYHRSLSRPDTEPDRPTAYLPGSDHQPALLVSWEDDPRLQASQHRAPPPLQPSSRKMHGMKHGRHHDDPLCSLWLHAWIVPMTPALFHGTPEPRKRLPHKPWIIASKAWHLLRRWKFRYLRSCPRRLRKHNAVRLWCLHDWVSIAHTAFLFLLLFLLPSLLRSLTHCIPKPYAPAKADRGPKPASRTRTRSRLLLSLLFLWQVQASRAASFSSGEPRVGSEATDPGASTSLHPRHMPANPGHYVPTLTGCRKRSFKRAVLRARHFGITRYRGRLCSVHDLLGRGEQSHPDTTSPHRSTPRPPPPGLRCSIMTWNAGGLTVTVWNEFLTWLLKTPHGHDIVCIQETYWRDDFEWDDDHWSYIHHGSHKPKEAGLLMCISKKLAQPHMIKHTPVLVGRLQHVRIFFPKGHQPLDVLHVYQHAWYHQKNDDQQDWWRGATERRHRFLQRLQATVRSFPIRNPLCLIGDFNTSLPHMTGLTGMGRPTKSGPQSDTADLCAFLEVHRLVACNTFGKAPAATFVNESTGAATQIDFIMLRQFHSDRESKKAKPFNWPVAASRKGAQHIPVQASFSLEWKPWGLSSALEIQNNIQPRQISDALKQDPNLEADFVCNLKVRLPSQPTAAQLDLALKQAWHDTSALPYPHLTSKTDPMNRSFPSGRHVRRCSRHRSRTPNFITAFTSGDSLHRPFELSAC